MEVKTSNLVKNQKHLLKKRFSLELLESAAKPTKSTPRKNVMIEKK